MLARILKIYGRLLSVKQKLIYKTYAFEKYAFQAPDDTHVSSNVIIIRDKIPITVVDNRKSDLIYLWLHCCCGFDAINGDRAIGIHQDITRPR